MKNYLSPQIRKDVHATFDKAIQFSWFSIPAVVVFGPSASVSSPQILFSVARQYMFAVRSCFFVWQIAMFISCKHDKKRYGVVKHSHRNPLHSPSVLSAPVHLPSYTLPSRVEREMSIDMVNDVPDVMTVDPTDDGLFSFMDNTVSGKTRTVYSPSKDG